MELAQLISVIRMFASRRIHWLFSMVLALPTALLACLLAWVVSIGADIAEQFFYVAPILGYAIGVALYIKVNLRVVPQMEAWAIDCFGDRLIFRTGLRLFCWLDWIDKLVMKRSLKALKL